VEAAAITSRRSCALDAATLRNASASLTGVRKLAEEELRA